MVGCGIKCKEQVEPIGVGIFPFAQKGVARLCRIGYLVLACCWVDGAQTSVQLVVNACPSAVKRVAEPKISLVVHLLIEGHCFLRVQQVELAVTRFHANGVLGSVAYAQGRFSFTRFCGHNDNAVERARTVNRGCRGIFQHLNVFYVGRIKACNGRPNQRGSIARCQLV